MNKIIKRLGLVGISMMALLNVIALKHRYDSNEWLREKRKSIISCVPQQAIDHANPAMPQDKNNSCPHMLGYPGSLCGLTEHKRRSKIIS